MENIEKAIALKAELDELRPLSDEINGRVMQKLRIDWNYHSNNLEGNSLTFGETKSLLLHGITAQGKPLKDHFEIKGHDEAIKWVLEVIANDYPLNQNFIRELHQTLLKEPYEVDAQTPDGKPTKRKIKIGEYKTIPNHVLTQTGEMFYFATPEETPAKMSDLLNWYETQKATLEPILLAAQFHYDFVRIHPFDDGNGRMARILMNFILMQFGYPPAVIKTEDKKNYFAALQQADGGNMDSFYDYIAQNAIHALEIMLKAAKGKSIDEPDDFSKKMTLLKHKIDSTNGFMEEKIQETGELRLSVFDNSIQPFLDKLLEKMKKFDEFYEKSSFRFMFGKTLFDESAIRAQLRFNKSFYLIFHYHNFKIEEKINSDFELKIDISFGPTRYEIKQDDQTLLGKIIVKKPYDTYFTAEEIEKFTNQLADLHFQKIEEKIERINRIRRIKKD